MTVTLTLNEISAEQAEKVLDLVKGEKQDTASSAPKSIGDPAEYEVIAPSEKNSADTDVTYTVEDVRKAFSGLAKKKGNDAAKNILKTFGSSKVTELKPECFGEVMKAIGEAV